MIFFLVGNSVTIHMSRENRGKQAYFSGLLSSIFGGKNERNVDSSGVTSVEGSDKCGVSGLNMLLHTGVPLTGHHVLNFDFMIKFLILFCCYSD